MSVMFQSSQCQSIPCLRCGCQGKIDRVNVCITSPNCECICCSSSHTGASCVYTNINQCKHCKKTYEFQRNGSLLMFLCDVECELYQRTMQQKADISGSPTKTTTLIHAVTAGNVDLTWELLQNGANPFRLDSFGNSALAVSQALLKSPSHSSATGQKNLEQIVRILPDNVVHDSVDAPTPPMQRTRSEFTSATVESQFPRSTRDQEGPQSPQTSMCGDRPQPFTSDDDYLPPLPLVSRSISLDTGKLHPTMDHVHRQKTLDGNNGGVTGRMTSLHRRTRQPIVTFRRDLVDGKQVFTPMTLEKVSSGDSNTEKSEPATDTSAFSDAFQKWTTSELNNMIVQQTEVSRSYHKVVTTFNSSLLTSPSQTRKTGHECVDSPVTAASILEMPIKDCSACLDPLRHEDQAYSCSHMGCHGCLCRDCLFRSVFVTITSALYAVPIIRCPGCLRRVQTSVWRGGLTNMAAKDISAHDLRVLKTRVDDNINPPGNEQQLLRLNEHLFETFETFVETIWMERDNDSDSDEDDDEDQIEVVGEDISDQGHDVEGVESSCGNLLNALANPSRHRKWTTDALDKDIVVPLHRCLWDIQKLSDQYIRYLRMIPDVNYNNEIPNRPLQPLGSLREIYANSWSLGIVGASSTENVLNFFSEFASTVYPGKVVERSGINEHIESMEATLDTLLDIGEGYREDAPAEERQQTWDVTKSALCQFMADLAVLLRTGEKIHLARGLQDIDGTILPVEDSNSDSDMDSESGDISEPECEYSSFEDDDENEDSMSDWGDTAEGGEGIQVITEGNCELNKGNDIIPELSALCIANGDKDDNNGNNDAKGNRIEPIVGWDSSPFVIEEKKKNGNKLYDFSIDINKESLLLTESGDRVFEKSADKLLLDKYLFNAKALLMLRCASCDETKSLFVTETKIREKPKKLNHVTLDPVNRQRLLSQLMKGLNDTASLNFLKTWNGFCSGGCPKVFIRLLIETFLNQVSVKTPLNVTRYTSDLNEGICSGEANKYMKVAFSLLLDVERRFTAHLEFLRQYPKIFTRCCNYGHCFLCKIEGHHKGKTCVQIQSEEKGIECQYCPGCNVPTLRSEGCSEILCVCGKVWEWEGSECDEDYSDDDDDDSDEDDNDDDSDDDSDGDDDGSSSEY